MATLHVLRVFTGREGGHGNALGVFVAGGEVAPARRQAVARDLGFSETVYVDDPARGEIRIFTPLVELPFAGHPAVGAAWLLGREVGGADVLRSRAGDLGVRRDGEMTWIAADPAWSPPFAYLERSTPEEVDALEGAPGGEEWAYCWAWQDRSAGIVRARSFVTEAGIPEDEATGSAALALCARIGLPIEVRQGRGSVIHARPLAGGMAEIGGTVELDEIRNYDVGA